VPTSDLQDTLIAWCGVFAESFKFTKSKLESLPPAPKGQVEYDDTIVNGLRVRVRISGVKSFCISRKRNGKFTRASGELVVPSFQRRFMSKIKCNQLTN